jgi:putative oxidoreductase
MATTFNSQINDLRSTHHVAMKAKSSQLVIPVARFLFALIFIVSGLNHFTSGSVSYAASQGIPMADILVPVSGLMALIGGLSVLLGVHARVGAILLLLFLIPVTVLMHNFWSFSDPEMAQMQMTHFLKNLAMMGGALMVVFYGAGPYSLDNRQRRKARRV